MGLFAGFESVLFSYVKGLVDQVPNSAKLRNILKTNCVHKLNMSFTGLCTLFITFNNTNIVIRGQEK